MNASTSFITSPTGRFFNLLFPPWTPLASRCTTNSATPKQAMPRLAWCAVECQSLYNLYSRCIGQYYVDLFMSAYCGNYSNVPCYLYENYTYLYDVYSLCNSSTLCSAPCRDATVALENYSGCCTSDTLNGPTLQTIWLPHQTKEF